jgi:hypothetical protein
VIDCSPLPFRRDRQGLSYHDCAQFRPRSLKRSAATAIVCPRGQLHGTMPTSSGTSPKNQRANAGLVGILSPAQQCVRRLSGRARSPRARPRAQDVTSLCSRGNRRRSVAYLRKTGMHAHQSNGRKVHPRCLNRRVSVPQDGVGNPRQRSLRTRRAIASGQPFGPICPARPPRPGRSGGDRWRLLSAMAG